MEEKQQKGTIAWMDLTVQDAHVVKDFYETVAGWKAEPVSMGEYTDFNLFAGAGKEPLGGICHAKGPNKHFPATWMIYITVEDLNACLETCLKKGGAIIHGPAMMGDHGRYAIIQDPAGAASALIEPASPS